MIRTALICLFLPLLLAGCSSTASDRHMNSPAMMESAFSPAGSGHVMERDRKIIREASIGLEVEDPFSVESGIRQSISRQGGYLDSTTTRSNGVINIKARVPPQTLDTALGEISELGKVTHRSVSARDVTETMVDLDARISNLAALHDRLQGLLQRAGKISEVIEIEKELVRVQTQLDSLEGQRRSLAGRVDYSTLDIELKQRTIYGPIGYVAAKAMVGLRKLFIIR